MSGSKQSRWKSNAQRTAADQQRRSSKLRPDPADPFSRLESESRNLPFVDDKPQREYSLWEHKKALSILFDYDLWTLFNQEFAVQTLQLDKAVVAAMHSSNSMPSYEGISSARTCLLFAACM